MNIRGAAAATEGGNLGDEFIPLLAGCLCATKSRPRQAEVQEVVGGDQSL